MPRVLDLMEHVFVEYGKDVVNPVKLHLSLRPHIDGYLNLYIYLIDSDRMASNLWLLENEYC